VQSGLGEESGSVKALGKYALAIASSLVVAVGIFYASAFVMDFLWRHVVVKNPENFGLGDGVVVVAGWFIFGTIFGLAGLILMLRRFWPRRGGA
jgi:hypothetical protein